MARLSDEERRARAEEKALRSAAWRARREEAAARRQAQQDRAAEAATRRGAGGAWIAETDQERRGKLARKRGEQERLKALKRTNPDQALVNEHVTREAQRHGDYARDTIPGPAIVKRGKDTPTILTVVRNRGGTTIERWHSQGGLTVAQVEAITIYARAWRLRFGEQRVTANWSMVSSVRGGSAPIEQFVGSLAQAKSTLDHLDDAVFFALPLHYFETWRNVVIFDEAAGVAGSRLGYRNDRAEAAAKAIVILIADMIATDLRLGTGR